jgi:hypothetical protein
VAPDDDARRLCVIEAMLPEGNHQSCTGSGSLNMLVMIGGCERSEAERRCAA